MVCSFKDVLKDFAFDFAFFYFEGLLLACPLRFETIDLTFVSKILVFDIES